MKRLFEINQQKQQGGVFGIEIEVEGRNLPHVASKTWKTEEDGSLRGGLEYVIVGAIPSDKVGVALRELSDAFTAVDAILDFSFRTSVHVHMNVQQLTHPQIANCIYTYLLLEDALMNYCGEQRKANRFCLRASDAENIFDMLEKFFKQGDEGFMVIPRNQARYLALNIEALTKYGSLEFRGMEGNMDIPRIVRWCAALLCLRSYACSKKDPMEIYEEFDKTTPEGFIANVLGRLTPYFTFPGLENSLKRSFSLSIALPFAYKEGEERRELREKRDKTAAIARDVQPILQRDVAQAVGVPFGMLDMHRGVGRRDLNVGELMAVPVVPRRRPVRPIVRPD